MSTKIKFELKGNWVDGEKCSDADEFELVLHDSKYYVLKDGATITGSWGRMHSFYEHTLPTFWEKKINGVVPRNELPLSDALPVLRSYTESMRRTADCSILSAGLYGSRARNDAWRYSDYDVLFVIDKNFNKDIYENSRNLFFDTSLKVSAEFDIDIAPCMYFVDDYEHHKQRGDEFIKNVEMDLIPL